MTDPRISPDSLRRHPYFLPFLIALLLHLAAVAASFFIILRGLTDEKDILPRFHLKSVSTKPVSTASRQAADAKRFVNAAASVNAEKQTGQVSDIPMKKLVFDKASSKKNTTEVAPKKLELEASSLVLSPDVDAVLKKAQETQLTDRVQPKQRSTAEADDRQHQRLSDAHRFDFNELVKSLQDPLQKLSAKSPANLEIDPEEGMPGFTPTAASDGAGFLENFRPDQNISGEPSGKIAPYEALDEFLDIEVRTYEDPKDHQKYYMIKIFAKKNAKFNVMEKEILFTIDCSLSITPDRLEEFKRGIETCLRNLNPGDVFNVVAFRDKPVFFSERPLTATPETIEAATRFVASLDSNKRTDVYAAFEDIVKKPLARRPSNVLLISDGRPTQGISDDRELLAAIARANDGARPIFAFTGGRRVNRYLLDFVAYQNRAWAEYVKRTADIDKALASFYEKIRNPIFINLRYELNGVDESDVFPKRLPDFYQNAEFTLFGTYSSEDKFSMQLLGDAAGQTKQLVFSRSLAEAEKGTEAIKRGYAFNKVYSLISRLSQEQDPALLEQVHELSRRYGITTPYSPELAGLD